MAISSGSLGKVSRWYNQRKASGVSVQPWELQKAYEAEIAAEADQASTNRSLDLSEASLEETKRSNAAAEAANLASIEASKKSATTGLVGQAASTAGTYYLLKGDKADSVVKSLSDWYEKNNTSPPPEVPTTGPEVGTSEYLNSNIQTDPYGSTQNMSRMTEEELAKRATEAAATKAAASIGEQAAANVGTKAGTSAATQLTGETAGASAGASAGSVGGGFVTGIGTAAAASAARQGLSSILSNQSSGYAKTQGELMKEPTFEGLIGAAGRKWLGDSNLQKTASQVMDPVGTVLKETGCAIIMTAIYGTDSHEVDMCRQYRDAYFTTAQLRGYYVFAEPVCFIMDKHPGTKKYFRKYLTEMFVDYSEWRLGKKSKLPSVRAILISKAFLKLCGYLGGRVPSYTRCTGEVV
jgi:hypothetical protein